ncbi:MULTISPECIES: hypothetical protein [unclassified Spirosoma]|uniref:hypothetical protein n=1 Tax=unclassified Spirosoma TaxID=2621999 RepID=UPI001AC58141|nr:MULTISPECIES: hypothetical protein [unclassified Spirosoma]MBN8820776.1 hypothetical protein [Spirosoma sp.]
MQQIFRTIWQFIKGNTGRFVWELVAVGIGIAVTWLISRFTGHTQLQACQDERAELLRENASAQSFRDSVRWSTVVADKNNQIHSLQNENDRLKEKAALDSAASHSQLEAMRAILTRYKK